MIAMPESYEYMICNRVSRGEAYVAGARQDICSSCAEHVWVSPSALMVSLSTPIVCVECAVSRNNDSDAPIEIAPMTEAQLAEMRQAGINEPAEVLERAALGFFERMKVRSRKRS